MLSQNIAMEIEAGIPSERSGLLGGGSRRSGLLSFGSSRVPAVALADAGAAPQPYKTPIWLTATNFANGVIGAGIIGLPRALADAGFIAGLVMIVVVGLMSAWTIRLLGNLGAAHSVYTYEALCQRAFGPAGFWLVCVFQLLFSLGAMISYLVIFADTVPAVLAATMDEGFLAAHPAATDRNTILCIAGFFVLLPLCLYRSYAQLARWSVVKLFAITFLVATVVGFKYNPDLQVATVKDEAWKYTSVHSALLPALGTIAFAFVCHHQTFLAYNSLRDPTPRRFSITVNLAILGSVIMSTAMGAWGYATFWETTHGDIFVNFSENPAVRDHPVMHTARLLVAVNMLFTFPSEMMVARHTIEALAERRRKHLRWLALDAPVYEPVALAQLKQEDDRERAAHADNWSWGKPLTRSLLEHVFLTILLFCIALAVACATTDVGKVLNITGSATAVFLAFVLPAAIRLRLGPTPTDELPAWHRSNWPAWAVLVFGALAFASSTVFSFIGLVTGEEYVLGNERR